MSSHSPQNDDLNDRISESDQSDKPTKKRESPGGRPMGLPGVFLTGGYLATVAILIIYGLIVLWPPDIRKDKGENQPGASTSPSPSTSPQGSPSPQATPGATASPQATLTASPLGIVLNASILMLQTPAETVRNTNAAQGSSSSATSPKACESSQRRTRYLGAEFCLSPEESLLIIVLLSGALGSIVHALRSFYWYAGNRQLVWSWVAMYFLLPFIGATIALVFYFVIRGGFFSPQVSVEATSPFGFAALSALIGMFTEEAVIKLKQIAETVLAKSEKGRDSAPPEPVVTSILPIDGPAAGGAAVTIKGMHFVNGATVTVGNQPATNVVVVNSTTITAITPAHLPGVVNVEVTTADNLRGVLANGFTYI